MAPREYYDPTTDDEVRDVFARQARLTRKVGRCMLVFAIVWLPALLIVPSVFKSGALVSLALSTIAAVAAMVIVERTWMKPRAAARDLRADVPPPPREYQSGPRRFLSGMTDRFQK